QYLQRVRVHHASILLADTEMSIGMLALETGFYDQAHLTRTFRRWFEMTPSEFRKRSKSSVHE
ncbi:MAG: helix-turn-helix transcriptional regulator, partial [Rubripirellula sp.]